jgi:hypothetical protein
MNKKAQIKIQEMAFMLVVLVIFFILVGLFALSIFYLNLYKGAAVIAEEKALSAITNLADSPEFTCGKPNCVDFDKAMVLSDNRNYENFWPFSSLKILKQSGFDKTESEMIKCNLANYPDCDLLIIYDKNINNEDTTKSFVGLCRKELEKTTTYDKCEIGELIIGTEIKIGEGQ